MKQLFNISNHAELQPAQSVLLIEQGERYCCLLILKKEGFEAERLIYYESIEDKLLDRVFAAHPELDQHYAEVLINYSFSQSITVPARYYSHESSRSMLHLMHGDQDGGGEAVLCEHLPDWQLYNVYEVPKPIHAWVSRKFHSGKYWHCYSSILNNLSRGSGENLLLADFRTGQFSVVLIKGGKFQLAQTFAYTQPADVLYYLLRICEGFSLSQKELQLQLSGFLEKQSALYQELYNYFAQVTFQKIPDFISFSADFQEYPAYFFSSVFNLATCVS